MAHLHDMYDSAILALQHLGDASADQLSADLFMQDAVIRRVTVIGEAARRIAPERRGALVDLPWSQIVGMRSVLVHEYDEVDAASLWRTDRNNLPDLVDRLKAFFDRTTTT